MKQRPKASRRRSSSTIRTALVPIDVLLEEALGKLPRPFKISGRKRGEHAYLLLALSEGLLALADYFEKIEEKRNVWRSDLVFRLEVAAGVKGRVAEAEDNARAIESILKAAEKSAGL